MRRTHNNPSLCYQDPGWLTRDAEVEGVGQPVRKHPLLIQAPSRCHWGGRRLYAQADRFRVADDRDTIRKDCAARGIFASLKKL